MAYFRCKFDKKEPDDMSNFKDLYKITSDNKYGVIRSSYNGPRYFRRLDYDRVVIGGAFWYMWSEYTIIHALCLIGKHPEDVSLRVSGDISDITRWTDSSPLGGYTITDNGITYYLSSLGDLFHTRVGAQLLPETSVEYIKKSENNPVFDTYIDGAMALLQLAKQ